MPVRGALPFRTFNSSPLALRVHLERGAGRPDEAALPGQAIHQYFKARAAGSRRTLRALFRRGRISLSIGLAFLAGSLALGDLIGNVGDSGFAALLREGFLTGGWVAMWRPLDVFLYRWWPVLGEARLIDRLGEMPVRIEYEGHLSDDAWRSDWPAVAPSRATALPRAHIERGSGRGPTMPSESKEHQHAPEEERETREAALDETIEASFPASDPPSSNPNPDDHAALKRRRIRDG